uniref:Dihydroxy-acid dehydratase n=1 Tax=Anthurium amnicola TaxID=1678845 RepID=A0A1D1ZF54_9ARAE
MKMATAPPKPLLQLCLLLAALVLLSSDTTHAVEEHQTEGDAADDSKLVCPKGCLVWVRGVCTACRHFPPPQDDAAATAESDTAAGDAVVEGKGSCGCCLWIHLRGSPRCLRYCCRDVKEAPARVEGATKP